MINKFITYFLTANIAFLTALCGYMDNSTIEWSNVYKTKLQLEMRLNYERGQRAQKTMEEETARSGMAGATVEGTEEGLTEAEYTEPEKNNEPTSVAEEAPTILETSQPEPETEVVSTVADTQPVVPAVEVFPKYSVNGAVLDYGVQDYLYRRLCEAGIGWFFPYSVMICYQESRFDPLAENPNGRDKGLFQYRVEYHPTLDWRNPYAEADIFIQQMANRAYAGCDILTMISRHKQSDWGPYDAGYVSQVLQWEGRMQRIQ